MDQPRPYRSVLYIPGSKERALEKAKSLPVDAIIFDLEDAVAIDEKENARALLAETLKTADYGPRARIVRINGLDTQWGKDDTTGQKNRFESNGWPDFRAIQFLVGIELS